MAAFSGKSYFSKNSCPRYFILVSVLMSICISYTMLIEYFTLEVVIKRGNGL
jgi:hypothetical protein